MKLIVTPINRVDAPGYILTTDPGFGGGSKCDTFEQLVDAMRDRLQEHGRLYGPQEPIAHNPYNFSVSIQQPAEEDGLSMEGGTFPHQ